MFLLISIVGCLIFLCSMWLMVCFRCSMKFGVIGVWFIVLWMLLVLKYLWFIEFFFFI